MGQRQRQLVVFVYRPRPLHRNPVHIFQITEDGLGERPLGVFVDPRIPPVLRCGPRIDVRRLDAVGAAAQMQRRGAFFRKPPARIGVGIPMLLRRVTIRPQPGMRDDAGARDRDENVERWRNNRRPTVHGQEIIPPPLE